MSRTTPSTSRCRFVYTPEYEFDIGAHVFPTRKFKLVRDALLADGDIAEDAFLEAPAASDSQLLAVHTPEYLDDLKQAAVTERTAWSEMPLSEEIVHGFRLAAGGTLRACRWALEHGLALNLAGGFHHAFPDHAEGFCYINDVAVAVAVLLEEKRIARAAVIDCDVHQGNGTAVIFEARPAVFTFSMHQERNYPIKRRSDRDIGLADGTGDAEYLRFIDENLPLILDSHRPDLVLYLAGADVYQRDQLGGLALTLEGLKRRDACVIEQCRARRIPLAAALAGGYAVNLDDTVRIHCTTARLMWEAGRQKMS
jgi:acetoin utilization deacetylase AcuC-like enzyme